MSAELLSRTMTTTLSPSEFLGVQYMCVVGVTLLLCDYFHALELEVSLVWPRKWNFVQFAFLEARYLPFFDVPVLFAFYFYSNSDPEVFSQECRALGAAATWLIAIGIGATELILVIRTHGLVGGRRKFLIYLIVQLMAFSTAILTIVGIATPTWNFLPASFPYGCNQATLIGNTRILLYVYVVVLVHELILTSITLYTGFMRHRGLRNVLVRTLHRDGIIYFALTSLTSLANIIVIVTTPQRYTGLLAIPQRVMHSVLATRIILQIRRAALQEETIDYQLSDLEFRTRMVEAESLDGIPTGTSSSSHGPTQSTSR